MRKVINHTTNTTVIMMTICSTLGPTGSTCTMTTIDAASAATAATASTAAIATPGDGAAGAAAASTGDEAASPPSCRGGTTSVTDVRTSNNNSPTVKASVKYRGEEGRKAVLSTCRRVLYDYGVLCSVVIVELYSDDDVDILSAHPDVVWVDADVQISFIAPMNTGMR